MSGWFGPTIVGSGGPFLPLAGGTMSGAITLANVVGTLTSGGSTATWTPTALTYTFNSARANGTGVHGYTITYTNNLTATGSTVFRILNNTTENVFNLDYNTSAGLVTAWYFGNVQQLTLTTSSAGSTFTTTADGDFLTLRTVAASSGAGGPISVTCGAGAGTGVGGTITFTGGAAGSTAGTQIGGGFIFTGGTGGPSGQGGSFEISLGDSGATAGAGGGFTLTAGDALGSSGTGGTIVLTAGNSTVGGGAAGSITITSGTSNTGNAGAISLIGGDAVAGSTANMIFTTGSDVSNGVHSTGSMLFTTGEDTGGTSGSFTFTVGTGDIDGSFSVVGAANYTLTAGTTPVMTMINSDAGAGGGPDIVLFRNSATAAANDVMGRFIFDGMSASAAARRTMGIFQSVLITATNGAEDARMEWLNIAGGASNLAMILSAGGLLSLDLDGGVGTAAYPVLFDEHDDVELIRKVYSPDVVGDAERREAGLAHWEKLGLVARKSSGCGWMGHVQPMLSLALGAAGQNHDEIMMLKARIAALEAR